jgi:hypothetical protein
MEYWLLSEAQHGNVKCFWQLTIFYNWFIRRVARAYTPKQANESIQFDYWNLAVEVFADTVSSISLDTHDVCFLEEYLRAAQAFFGPVPTQKKSFRVVDEALRLEQANHTRSLHEPEWGEEGRSLEEKLSNPNQKSVPTILWLEQLRERVHEILHATLSPEEHTLVTLYFFNDAQMHEVARRLDKTPERARQMLGKVLRKLRTHIPKDLRACL